MQYLDRVRLLTDKYEKDGAKKGDEGTILFPEIRWGTFYVVFCDEQGRDYAEICADVFDFVSHILCVGFFVVDNL